MESYNLDTLLKKKRKNLYNRMHAAGKNKIIMKYNRDINIILDFYSAQHWPNCLWIGTA